MVIGEQADEALRRFETTVLDVHHHTMALWHNERPLAVYAALAQFDCWAVLSLVGGSPDFGSAGLAQTFKGMEEGLSQAMRWLHPGKPQFDLVPADSRQIVGDAGDFCQFASRYVDLADMHKMYGRGQVAVEVDEQERRVRFVPLTADTPLASLLGMVESANTVKRGLPNQNSSQMTKLREDVFRCLAKATHHCAHGQLVLDDLQVANSEDITTLLELWIPAEPMLLADNDDLVGFSVSEFVAYFEALRRWSFCCTFVFLSLVASRRKHQWECIPTQIIDRHLFFHHMQALSGLDANKVVAITDRLRYDDRTKSPEVFQQPLFCGANYVSWSVEVIQKSKYLRNMLKLMSRTSNLRDHAATLIGARERPMLWELGDLLSRRGGCSYSLRKAVAHGGQNGEIDLLAYNRKFPEEVLLLEAKAVLGVDEVNEVATATKEMQDGQRQLKHVDEIIKAIPEPQKRSLFPFVDWRMVTQHYGIVVALDAEPNNLFDHTVYPGISLQTIKARLRDNHFASPRKLWNACRERRWLAKLPEYTRSYKPIQVGDVTYELPTLIGQAGTEEIAEE